MNKTLCTILAALALAGCPKKAEEPIVLGTEDASGNCRDLYVNQDTLLVDEQRIYTENGQIMTAKYRENETEITYDHNGDGVAEITTTVPASEMPRPRLPWLR